MSPGSPSEVLAGVLASVDADDAARCGFPRGVNSKKVVALQAALELHVAQQRALDPAGLHRNLPNVCVRPASNLNAFLHAAPGPQQRLIPTRANLRPRVNHDSRTIAVPQEIPTPRTSPHHDEIRIHPAGRAERLSPNIIAVPDEMASVHAGSAGSIDNLLELPGHRPVPIPHLGPVIARQDVQRHELRTLTRSDRDRPVDRCSIRRPSIGGEQHDARRPVNLWPRQSTWVRTQMSGSVGHALHRRPAITAAVGRFGTSGAVRMAR